ncbi:MAG: ribonuclease P protein component [Helicobacteraceae bacterium]|jgi:ribonuclease P protein component|nr:ribonuclease P protein component [Helicobacteraceae bacterium]
MRTPRSFTSVFEQAKSFHSAGFVFFYQNADVNEVGFVASKKVGGAVDRNFARRRMRELFRAQAGILPRGRFVVLAKKPIGELPYSSLREQFSHIVRQITKSKG